MDVKCEKCGTEYEFDDAKVTEAGITVKCTHCGHLFRVAKSPEAPTAPPPDLPAPARQWMIRSGDGEIRKFSDLATLQQWIVERKVSREDEISKNGGSWKPLGSIIELSSFFVAVEGTRPASRPVLPASAPPARLPPEPVESRFDAVEEAKATVTDDVPPMLRQPRPGFESMRPMNMTHPPMAPQHSGVHAMPSGFQSMQSMPPAPMDPTAFPGHTPLGFDHTTPPSYGAQQSGGAARGFMVGVLASVALAGGAYFVFDQFWNTPESEPTVSKPIAAPASAPAPKGKTVDAAGLRATLQSAKIAYMRDTADGFAQAEGGFQSALVQLGEPPAFAELAAEAHLGIARIATAQAEYERLEGRSGRMGLAKAERALDAARALAPTDPDVELGWADLERVRGRDSKVAQHLKGAGDPAQSGPRLVSALRRLHEGEPPKALVERLERLDARALSMPRARYLKAWALRAAGQTAQARVAINELLTVAPGHGPAQRLLATLEKTEKPETTPEKQPEPEKTPEPKPETPAPKPVKKPAKKPVKKPAVASGASFDSLMDKGHALLERGQTTQARRLFMAAIQKSPGQPAPFANLGWCELDQNRPRAAVDHFKKALRRSARYADAMYGLGVAYEKSGDSTRAREAYQKYISTHPSSRKAAMVRRKLERLK